MKHFKSFISEMASERGFSSSKSLKSDWDDFYKDSAHITLVQSDLGRDKYKVYKTKLTYFLTKDNEYKGHIQGSVKNKVFSITSSQSEIKKGFYRLMFTVILSDGINEILSDSELSTQAINSYLRQYNTNKNHHLKYRVKLNNSYLDMSKNNLLSTGNAVVSVISENTKDFMKMYYNRLYKTITIDNKTITEDLGRDMENYSINVDLFLIGTTIEQ